MPSQSVTQRSVDPRWRPLLRYVLSVHARRYNTYVTPGASCKVLGPAVVGSSIDDDGEYQDHYTIDVALCNVETPIAYATFVLPSRTPQHRCVYYDVDPCTILDEYHVVHRPQAFLDPFRKAPKVYDVLRTPDTENPQNSSPAKADNDILSQSSLEPDETTAMNTTLAHSYGSPSSSSLADELQDDKSSEASTPEKKGQISNPTTPSSSVVSTPDKLEYIVKDSKIHTFADILKSSSQSLNPIEKFGSNTSTHPSAEAFGDKKAKADIIIQIEKESTVTDSNIHTLADALESSDRDLNSVEESSSDILARHSTKAQTTKKIKASKKSKAEKKRSQGSKIQESLSNLKIEYLQELGYPVQSTANGNDYSSSPVTNGTSSVKEVIEAPSKSELGSANETEKVAANSRYSIRGSDLSFSQESFSVNTDLPLKNSVSKSTSSTLRLDATPITEPSTATHATKKQKKSLRKAKKICKVGDDSINAKPTDQINLETSFPKLTSDTSDTGVSAAINDPARSCKDTLAANLSPVASAKPDLSVQIQSGTEKSSPNLSDDVPAKAKSKKGRAGKKVKAKKEKAALKKAGYLSIAQTEPNEGAEHYSTVPADMLSGSVKSAPEHQLDSSVEDAEVQAGKDNDTILDTITEVLTPPESPEVGKAERVEHNGSEDTTIVAVNDKDKKPEDHVDAPSHVVHETTDPQLDGIKPLVSVVHHNPNRLLLPAEASVDSEKTKSAALNIGDKENYTSQDLLNIPDIIVITTNNEETPADVDVPETASDTEPFPEVDQYDFDEARAQEENRVRKESLLLNENRSQNKKLSHRPLPQGVDLTCGETMAWLRGEGKYTGQVENLPPYMEFAPVEQLLKAEGLSSVDTPVHFNEHVSSNCVGQSQGVPDVLIPGDSESIEKVTKPQNLNQKDVSIYLDNHTSNDDVAKTDDVAKVSASGDTPSVADPGMDATTKEEIYNPGCLLSGETSWFLETTKSTAMGDTNEEEPKPNTLGKEYLTQLAKNLKQKTESDKGSLEKEELSLRLEMLEGQLDGSLNDTVIKEDIQHLGQATQGENTVDSTTDDIQSLSINTQQEMYNPKCLLIEGESSYILDKMRATVAGDVDYSELQPKTIQSANEEVQTSQGKTTAKVLAKDGPTSSINTQQEFYNPKCLLKEGQSSWILDKMNTTTAGDFDYSELQPKVKEPDADTKQFFQHETTFELPNGGSDCQAAGTQQKFHSQNIDYSELKGDTAKPVSEAETAPEPPAEGSPTSSTSTQDFYNPNCLLQEGESSWFLNNMKGREAGNLDYSELHEKTLEPAPQDGIAPEIPNGSIQSSSAADVDCSKLEVNIAGPADDGIDSTLSEETATEVPTEESSISSPRTQETYNPTCLFKNRETSWIFEKMKAKAASDMEYTELQPKIMEPADNADQCTSPDKATVESAESLEDISVVEIPKDVEDDDKNKLTSPVDAVAECPVPADDLSVEIEEHIEPDGEYESTSPDAVIFESPVTLEDFALHETPEEIYHEDANQVTSLPDVTVEFESPVSSENLFDYKFQQDIKQASSQHWSKTKAATTVSQPPEEILPPATSPVALTENWSVIPAVETISQPIVANSSPTASVKASAQHDTPQENSAGAVPKASSITPTILQSLQAIDIVPIAEAIQQDPTNKFLILQLLLVLFVRFVLLLF